MVYLHTQVSYPTPLREPARRITQPGVEPAKSAGEYREKIGGKDRGALHKVTRHRLNQLSATVLYGLALAVSCVISYWLITHILAHAYSISRDDDLLGGMWAVVATLFVHRYSYEQSMRAALSRTAATSVSFALCLVYLLIFPFHLWGMATLIGIGAVAVALMGRPDDTVTTGITTVVIMVVAALSPQDAWRVPILRTVDTVVGVAVGIAAAWIGLRATRHLHAAPPEPASAIAHYALDHNTTLREAALKTGFVNEADFARIVDPKTMVGNPRRDLGMGS